MFIFSTDKIDYKSLSLEQLDNLVENLSRILNSDTDIVHYIEKHHNVKIDAKTIENVIVNSLISLLGFYCGYHDDWLRPSYSEYVDMITSDTYYQYPRKLLETDHFKIVYYNRFMVNWISKLFPDKVKEEIRDEEFLEDITERFFDLFSISLIEGYEQFIIDSIISAIHTLYENE